MGAEHVDNLPSPEKSELGSGSTARGTETLIEKLKALQRAEMIAASAQAKGKSVHALKVRVRKTGPQGEVQVKVGYRELMDEAAPLEPHRASCERCPANVRRSAFGCVGLVAYPLPAEAEGWLLDRLEPADRLGGQLCLKAVQELGYDGQPIQRMRDLGLLELPRPLTRDLGAGTSRPGKLVRSDQILHALLGAGPTLSPWHCALVLLWLGTLEIDGKVPDSWRDTSPLDRLKGCASPKERAAATSLVLGPRTKKTEELHGLLRAMYRAWALQVPLRVEG